MSKTKKILTYEEQEKLLDELSMKGSEEHKKYIDDEILSLILRQNELEGATDLDQLEIQLGFEFVEMNKKRIKTFTRFNRICKG